VAGSAGPAEIVEEAPKTKKETRESLKPSAKPKIGFYKPQPSYPGGHLQVETARSATSPGGTRRPAVTLIGLANPVDQEPIQTYQVRGLRRQSEIRRGSGPEPSERVELAPRPPIRQSPALDAPWNRPSASELKRTHSKGFRLRSAQSCQYRNLRGQLRLAKKQRVKVDSGLKEQVDRFGKGRQETFKRNPIRLKSVSRHPIRLRSVAKAKATPSSSAKAKPRPKAKAKAKARTLARDRVRGPAEIGLKVHGRALKLSEKIRNLANKWAANHQLSAYFLESPFQVRHLAARQLQLDTGATAQWQQRSSNDCGHRTKLVRLATTGRGS